MGDFITKTFVAFVKQKSSGDRIPMELVCSCFLSIVFLSAGLSKFLDLSEMTQLLDVYSFPDDLKVPFITLLAGSELCLAASYVIRPWRRISALVGALLLFTFSGVLLHLYILGVDANCGCGMLFMNQKIGFVRILQNVVFGGMSLALWRITTMEKGGEQR